MHASSPDVIGIPIVSDVLDWAGGALKWIDDNIIKRIPGSEWVKAAINQGKKWLVDFSKTEIGFRTLQLIANNAYQPLAWMIGPQVASIVWATPGMVRGDAFSDAYTKELIARIEGLVAFIKGGPPGAVAAYYGIGGATKTNDQIADIVTSQLGVDFKKVVDDDIFKKAIAQILSTTKGLDDAGIRRKLRDVDLTPEQIANKLKKKIPTLRPDVVAVAMNGALHKPIYDVNGSYQISDGQPSIFDPLAVSNIDRLVQFTHFDAEQAAAAVLDGFSRPKRRETLTSFRVAPPTSFVSQAVLVALLTSPLWGPAIYTRYGRRHAS